MGKKPDMSKYEVKAVSEKANPSVWLDFAKTPELEVTRKKIGLVHSLLGDANEYLGKIIIKDGVFQPAFFNRPSLTKFELRAIADKIEELAKR